MVKEITDFLGNSRNLLIFVLLLMTLLGLDAILGGGTGIVYLPYADNLVLPQGFGRLSLSITGGILLLVGIIPLCFYIKQQLLSDFKERGKELYNKTTNSEKKHGEQILEKIICDEATLLDTCLGDDNGITEMPEERGWTYELDDVVINIYKDNKLSLEYEALIKSPDCKKTQVYKSYGMGPFINGVAYIIYSFEEKKTGSPNWKGAMVLRVPDWGEIVGYWLTTNVKSDTKFPVGIIRLKRKA